VLNTVGALRYALAWARPTMPAPITATPMESGAMGVASALKAL
jgi:hypothetical protein